MTSGGLLGIVMGLKERTEVVKIADYINSQGTLLEGNASPEREETD